MECYFINIYMNKIITIEGTSQRYQMKKVEKVKKEKQFIKPIIPFKENISLLEEEQLIIY